MKLPLFALLASFSLFGAGEPSLPLPKAPIKNHASYGYVSAGLAGFIPKVAVGYRFQKGGIGGDFSFTEAAIPPHIYSHGLQYSVLFYPKPNLAKEGYWGLNGGLHGVFLDHKAGWIDASLGVLGGYQFAIGDHTHFFEMKVGFPLLGNALALAEGSPSPISIIIPSVAYGVSF